MECLCRVRVLRILAEGSEGERRSVSILFALCSVERSYTLKAMSLLGMDGLRFVFHM